PHCEVIDNAGEIVERRTVGTHDREIADLIGRERDIPLDQVVNDQGAAQRHLKPQGVRAAFALAPGELLGGKLQATESISSFGPLRGRLLGRPLGLGAVVAVNMAAIDQLLHRRLVLRGPMRLVVGTIGSTDVRPFVPIDADPPKTVEDALDGILDVPLLVGVVDPQQKLAAEMPGKQPVEQGRSHSADVQKAGRTGSKPGAYGHGAFSQNTAANQTPARSSAVAIKLGQPGEANSSTQTAWIDRVRCFAVVGWKRLVSDEASSR